MAREPLYGFPCVENPHDFEPDRDSCTAKEIAAWEDAKRRWDAGERDVRGNRSRIELTDNGYMHICATSWGIGVSYIEMGEEDDG